jgi:hypothetical protein
MAKPLIVRIVIADGEHVRFVQPDVDNVLRTIGSLDSASAHLRSRDIGSDRPGRSFESGAGARHAVGQRHDRHEMEKKKFVHLIGEQIDAEVGTLEKDLVKTPDHELSPHVREWVSPARRPRT